MLLDLKVMLLN